MMLSLEQAVCYVAVAAAVAALYLQSVLGTWVSCAVVYVERRHMQE